MKKIAVAIDGPGGAGKSTISKAVAKKLGIIYVDTGALYRTVGYYARENGVSVDGAKTAEKMTLKSKWKIGVSGAESFGTVKDFFKLGADKIAKGFDRGGANGVRQKSLSPTQRAKTGDETVNIDTRSCRKKDSLITVR